MQRAASCRVQFVWAGYYDSVFTANLKRMFELHAALSV
jgi:hypothetical protein